MIYLDNAATTINKPEEMTRALCGALSQGNAGRGLSESSLSAARTIYTTREKLASMFGAEINRTIFTANATHSLNLALLGLIRPGDSVLTSSLEHNSVLRPLYALQRQGVELNIFKPEAISITVKDVEKSLKASTNVLVLTHASNVLGGLTQIREIGALCRDRNILFILDASQTAGVFPIDMEKDGIDALCFTGHKALLGPQGTGGLCLSKRVEPKPIFSGGTGIHSFDKDMPSHLPDRLEAGTLNGHGIAGLGGSLDYLLNFGLDKIMNIERNLACTFYDALKEIPEVKIYSENPRHGAAIVTINLGDEDSGVISDILMQEYGIATRPGAHCAPLVHEMLGTVEQGALRFSFCHYNTIKEIHAAVEAVKELAQR